MSHPHSISVVIPCYNHGRYLEEAVDSVFAQTRQDFDILIVNDGSTDPATNELLRTWNRPRTRVVHTENRGLPGARNVGIRLSEGPFVCTLDADDILAPTWFERAMEVLEADADVAFVSHWLRTFGDEEWEWTPERCDLPSLLDMNTVNGAAVARRAVLEEVGLYDESWRDGCEDWELWIRVVERGHRGVIVPDFLFNYRRRADSMSRAMNRPERQIELFRRLVEDHAPSYRTHLLELFQRRETNLTDLRGELDDLDREHHGWWRPELERRRAEVAALRRRVEKIRAREAEIEEHAATRRALADAEARVHQLGAFEERNRHLEADLDGHRRALADANAEITELRRLQDAAHAAGQELQTELEARLASAHALHAAERVERERVEADLDGHRQALAETLADLDGHRQALADARTELEALRRELEARGSEFEARGSELDLERRAHRDARAEVDALRASLSWRATAPLRTLLGWLAPRRGDAS